MVQKASFMRAIKQPWRKLAILMLVVVHRGPLSKVLASADFIIRDSCALQMLVLPPRYSVFQQRNPTWTPPSSTAAGHAQGLSLVVQSPPLPTH